MTTIYGSYQRRCQNELTDIIQALGKQFGFDPIAAVAFINDTQVDESIRMERPQVAKRKSKVSAAEKAAAKQAKQAEKLAAKEAKAAEKLAAKEALKAEKLAAKEALKAEKAGEKLAAKEAKAVEKLIKQINEVNAEADTALLSSTALKALLKAEKKKKRDAAKAAKKAEKLAAKKEAKARTADVASILDQIIADASSEESDSEELEAEAPATLKTQLEDQIAALGIEDSDDEEESIASLVIDSDED